MDTAYNYIDIYMVLVIAEYYLSKTGDTQVGRKVIATRSLCTYAIAE